VIAAHRRFLARACAAAIALAVCGLTPTAQTAPVHGIYNWIHSTGDAERAFAFYHDVFGIELARSPFAGGASSGAPEPIRPAAQAGSDPLVWDLTNTHGSRFRTVFMRAPNTPFGLELSEFFDIARGDRAPNPWDPGASTLIFSVRDLDAVAARLKLRASPVVTLGGVPVMTSVGRAVLVRDPDGCLIEARQAPPESVSKATAAGEVIDTSIGITVANRARAREFYGKLLGFEIRTTRTAGPAELRLRGLAAGTLRETAMSIPGTAVTVVLSEFSLPAGAAPPARRFDWRLQDVGSPQFQLEVSGLDAVIDRTKTAGYHFLSVGAKPIQRAFGRFVFAIDPDAVLVEFVEPRLSAAPAPPAAPLRTDR
jgi:predicted enzyme related to lactoylglutathione lyase